MKLRYEIDMGGRYVPQYLTKEDKWESFKLRDLGGELTQLYLVAFALRKEIMTAWGRSHGQFYYFPNKGEKPEDMALFFENEIKCAAFLGAAKVYYGNRTKEIEL